MTSPDPRCRTCKSPIRFVRMETGRAMPVAVDPDPAGIVIASWDGRGFSGGRVVPGTSDTPVGWRRFRPHWADCEKARLRTKGARPAPPAPKPRPDFLF